MLDLLHWPAGSQTHRLAAVDTLLIRRKDHRSESFDAFLGILQQAATARPDLSP